MCVCVCVSVGARQKRKQDHLEDTVKVAVMSLECCGPATQKDGGVCGRGGGRLVGKEGVGGGIGKFFGNPGLDRTR